MTKQFEGLHIALISLMALFAVFSYISFEIMHFIATWIYEVFWL